MSKIPGEHWCSICEKNVSKHKGTYVKLYARGVEGKKAEQISVICPVCLKKDKDLSKGLKLLQAAAKPVEVVRGRVCSFCESPIKRKERSLKAEFRYNGSELRAEVCEKCIDEYDDITDIHVKAPNPVFKVDVKCVSAENCKSFKKPPKDRGINCNHVVANMDGQLYCRRGHPGHLPIYRERWAFPPSQRQLRKMLKFLGPLSKIMEERAQLLEEKPSVAQKIVSREIPDTFEYELRKYPLDGNNVTIPWNAQPIDVMKDTLIAMVRIEKEEEQ